MFLSVLLVSAVSACGDRSEVLATESPNEVLQAIADDNGLAIRDVSVPFEQLVQAPNRLEGIGRALQGGPSAVYVMRYSDDTLRHILHVFVVDDSTRAYLKLSAVPGKKVRQERHDINAARFDEELQLLVLDTPSGEIRLSAEDVTPVGA